MAPRSQRDPELLAQQLIKNGHESIAPVAGTCCICKEMRFKSGQKTAICNKKMQPAFPYNFDGDLPSSVATAEPPCSLFHPSTKLQWYEMAELPARTKNRVHELKLRIARCALKGNLSPEFEPPWPLEPSAKP